MLKIDLDTQPGGAYARWRKGQGLTLHRRDGSMILKINAAYADERALSTAAHALTFMLRGHNDSNATARDTSAPNQSNNQGDGGQA